MQLWKPGYKNNDMIVDQIPPPGYHIISHPRVDGCSGGGVALIYKDGIKVSDHKYNPDEKCLECSIFNINVGCNVLDLLVVYRQLVTSVTKFCEELASILESDIASMHGKLILTGDFNIHIEFMSDPDTITFMDFLDCFNLQNHVNFSTHIQHHHLGLVISDVLDSIVSSSNPGHLLSDHWFIHAKLHINKPVPLNTEISYRIIKSIDHQDLNEPFQSELCVIHQIDNLHQAR